MKNTEFKTKEEYLQYRNDWKAEYKQLSQTIREKRWLYKEYSRMWNKAYVAHGNPFILTWDMYENGRCNRRFLDYLHLMEKENKQYQILEQKYREDKNWLGVNCKQATQMLEELKEAKQKAWRQYKASK